MRARWLIMLLGANAGGWTTVVSMAGHVEPRALRFYKKAVNGTLKTVTPHTEEFKSTVTTDGMSGFEGIVEGELLSPCELEPAPNISFVGDMYTVQYSQEHAKLFIKNWRSQCRAKLHGISNENKNIWIGVMLGIIAHPTKYLCHRDECKEGGRAKQINLVTESTVGKIWNDAFNSPDALKNNYKLTETFFKSIGRAISGGAGNCQTVFGGHGVSKTNCDKFIKKVKEEKVEEECPWTGETDSTKQYDQKCFEWAKKINRNTKLFVLEKQSDVSKKFTEENWWENSGSRKMEKAQGNNQGDEIAFWWWWGADPESQGENERRRNRKKAYDEIRRYWNSSLGASNVCIPVPAMLRKESFQTNFDITIEAIRCGQKNL